jgi:peptidoglycan/xylan/chitin deacetylase (PgdA/CDA1 family)
VLIVTYHAIEGSSSPVCCTASQFEADLDALSNAAFTFVSLDACAEWLSGLRQLPPRSIAVTFDDAYASVVTTALPVLTRLRVPATVFVIGERIGRDNQWPGQWKSIPPMRLADVGQLKEAIAAGMTIGSHSWSHAVLPQLDPSALQTEVEESAARLEQLLEAPVRHFAYPYGIRGTREIATAGRRYRTAVNADPRQVLAISDPHDLCRVDAHDLRIALRLKLVHLAAMQPYLALRRTFRHARRGFEALTNAR